MDLFQCPYASAFTYHQQWRNYSGVVFDGNVHQYHSYICQFASYQYLKKVTQPVERQLIIFFSVCGFLGGLLTVLTLSQKRFRVMDFQLYRVIGYLEMVQMADLAIMDLLAYMKCESSYACTFLWAHIGFVVMNVCADATDILVLFLCVERTVACLLPHYFQRLHTRKCYIWAMVFSVVIPAFFSSFQAFELRVVYDPDENRYHDEPSEFAESEFYANITHMNTARFYIMAALIMITTSFSLWGFYAVARRRRNLSRDYGNQQGGGGGPRPVLPASSSTSNLAPGTPMGQNNSSSYMLSAPSASAEQRQALTRAGTHHQSRSGTGGSSRRMKKREMELCCLQLCLAAPIIINHILYATGLNMNYGFVIGEAAFKKNLTFDKARSEIEAIMDFYYMRMATNLTNVLAHALHFYLYLLFSVQVRHGFLTLVRSCRSKLQPGSATVNGSAENHLTVMSAANEISLA